MVNTLQHIGSDLRNRRDRAGISGAVVCAKIGINRNRLTSIERGYIKPSEDEVSQIEAAIDLLAAAREQVVRVAAEVGWPVAAL